MSNTDYSFQGLDKWEQRLSEAVNKAYPKEFERMVVDIAVQLEGKAKEKTPVKTGHLRNQWRVGKIKKRGNEYYIEVSNNADYAEPVEYGHRTKGGNFKEGAHMIELSLAEVSERLPGYLRQWLDEFLNTHVL